MRNIVAWTSSESLLKEGLGDTNHVHIELSQEKDTPAEAAIGPLGITARCFEIDLGS